MSDRDFSGLLKIAYSPTVGDVIRAMNADFSADPTMRRRAIDRINSSGVSVSSPASRLMSVIGGGAVASFIARYLGMGAIGGGLAFLAGGIMGGRAYDRSHGLDRTRGYRINL